MRTKRRESTPAPADGKGRPDGRCSWGHLLCVLTLPITCRCPTVSFRVHSKPYAGSGQVERWVRCLPRALDDGTPSSSVHASVSAGSSETCLDTSSHFPSVFTYVAGKRPVL